MNAPTYLAHRRSVNLARSATVLAVALVLLAVATDVAALIAGWL